MLRSFALGEHFERFIDAQVATGRFNNASEVVHAGLRLLEDREKPPALTVDDLRALIREGMDSGPGRSSETVLGRLKAKYCGMADTGSGE